MSEKKEEMKEEFVQMNLSGPLVGMVVNHELRLSTSVEGKVVDPAAFSAAQWFLGMPMAFFEQNLAQLEEQAKGGNLQAHRLSSIMRKFIDGGKISDVDMLALGFTIQSSMLLSISEQEHARIQAQKEADKATH